VGADDAPPADAPRSAEAKQASQAYDKAVREARKAFDASIEKAKKKCIADLNTALDKAMERRDLNEANRIKAQIAAIAPRVAVQADVTDLFNKTWYRLSRSDAHNDSKMQFLPDGSLQAEGTGWIAWQQEGEKILLSKKEGGKGTELEFRAATPVLYTADAPEGGFVLIPKP
jgi:hypothetical protein